MAAVLQLQFPMWLPKLDKTSSIRLSFNALAIVVIWVTCASLEAGKKNRVDCKEVNAGLVLGGSSDNGPSREKRTRPNWKKSKAYQFTPNLASTDDWEILGLKRGASKSKIKDAYREATRRYHSDVNPGDATAETNFKTIQTAYANLTKPKPDFASALDDISRALDAILNFGKPKRAISDPLKKTPREFANAVWSWAHFEGLGQEGYEPGPMLKAIIDRVAKATANAPDVKVAFIAAVQASKDSWEGPDREKIQTYYDQMLFALYARFEEANPTSAERDQLFAVAGHTFEDLAKGFRNPTPDEIGSLKGGNKVTLFGEIISIGKNSLVLKTPEGQKYPVGISGWKVEIESDWSAKTRKLRDPSIAEVGDHILIRVSPDGSGKIEAYSRANIIVPGHARLKRYQKDRKRVNSMLSSMDQAAQRTQWKELRALNVTLWKTDLTAEEIARQGKLIARVPSEERPIRIARERLFDVEAVNRMFGLELDGMTQKEFLTFLDRWARRELLPKERGDATYLFRTIGALGLPDTIMIETAKTCLQSRLKHLETQSSNGMTYDHDRDFEDTFIFQKVLHTLARETIPNPETVKFFIKISHRIVRNEFQGWGYGKELSYLAMMSMHALIRQVDREEFADKALVKRALKDSLLDLELMHHGLMGISKELKDRHQNKGPAFRKREYLDNPYASELEELDEMMATVRSWADLPMIGFHPNGASGNNP